RTLTGHSRRTLDRVGETLAYSPDGRWLVSSGLAQEDPDLIVWDTASGRELHRLRGHTRLALHLAFSPDGKTLASDGVNNTVKLWAVPSGRLLHTLAGHENAVQGVAFSLDGRQLTSFDNYDTLNLHGGKPRAGTVKLWDVATGQELHTWRTEI